MFSSGFGADCQKPEPDMLETNYQMKIDCPAHVMYVIIREQKASSSCHDEKKVIIPLKNIMQSNYKAYISRLSESTSVGCA